METYYIWLHQIWLFITKIFYQNKMRPTSQNIRFFIFYSQIIILFLILMMSGCTHFKPGNEPNSSTQNELKQSFFSNGNLEYEAEFVNGKLDGTSKVWLEDGILYSIAKYSNNHPHGIWKIPPSRIPPIADLLLSNGILKSRITPLLKGRLTV